MIARIAPGRLKGKIKAIPSKSEAHRMLICAALADRETRLEIGGSSQDIEATVRCLEGLGAKISVENEALIVRPVDREKLPESCLLDCGESGSTLRFMLPVAGALGVDATFKMGGRLPERPIVPLDRELIKGGCRLDRPEKNLLRIHGRLGAGKYCLPGNVSSQYITGMLLALSLCNGQSWLGIEGKMESAGYVDMTLQAMAKFGVVPQKENGFIIPGGWKFASPGDAKIEGDWSNGAFWLCADALEGCDVQLEGLNKNSAQGDKRISEEIANFLAAEGSYTVDAANIPDLVPALAACACAAKKEMRFINAQRLRIKESDRIATVIAAVKAVGGCAEETEDGLIVRISEKLSGGAVDAAGDHRIAMMAAIASVGCEGEVIVRGAEAVNKSYPGFWRDFAFLGGKVKLTEN